MQYIDAICRGLYQGFLSLGQIMTRPSTMGVLLAFAVWFVILFIMPKGVVEFVCGALAGWYMGGKIGDLHTYLRNRFD
jgi:hypothetical protein